MPRTLTPRQSVPKFPKKRKRSAHDIQDWVHRVEALAKQVVQWSKAQGWAVKIEKMTIDEENVGVYRVPSVRVAISERKELYLEPRALEVLSREVSGRVDLHAFPTMARVMFLGVPGGWQIMTTSNIPVRQPWTPETLVQLAQDMLK